MIMTRTFEHVNMQYDVLVCYNINIADSEKKIRGKPCGSGSDEQQ